MKTINLNEVPYKCVGTTILVSEKNVAFATEYQVVSKTGTVKSFKFDHSTGSEFDPATRRVYICEDLTLEVCNDQEMSDAAMRSYFEAKVNRLPSNFNLLKPGQYLAPRYNNAFMEFLSK